MPNSFQNSGTTLLDLHLLSDRCMVPEHTVDLALDTHIFTIGRCFALVETPMPGGTHTTYIEPRTHALITNCPHGTTARLLNQGVVLVVCSAGSPNERSASGLTIFPGSRVRAVRDVVSWLCSRCVQCMCGTCCPLVLAQESCCDLLSSRRKEAACVTTMSQHQHTQEH